MSQRYFLHLSYLGTNYRGYQRQPDQLSVQQTLEEKLSEVLRQEIIFSGCGRTDAGVHASQYFGSIDVKEPLPDHFLRAVNRQLPGDISIYEAIPVSPKASARFDATERVYDYFIHLDKDAGLDYRSSKADGERKLNIQDMLSVTKQLPSFQDFRAYCKTPDRHNSTICHLKSVKLFTDAKERFIRIEFIGNRYLRGMIRLLVGNLLRVGDGRNTPDGFLHYLATKTPPQFTHLAPPDGLYLSKISYPYFERTNQSPLHRMLVGLTNPI